MPKTLSVCIKDKNQYRFLYFQKSFKDNGNRSHPDPKIAESYLTILREITR